MFWFGLVLFIAAIVLHVLYRVHRKKVFLILGFLVALGASVVFIFAYYPQTKDRYYGSIFESEMIKFRRNFDNVSFGFCSVLGSVSISWWLGWFIGENIVNKIRRKDTGRPLNQ